MIDPINICERSIGVNFSNSGVAEILFWAPSAKTVSIMINSALKLPLHEKGLGYWHLSTNELQPGDFYKFVINDDFQIADPASLSQPEGVHGSSQAIEIRDFEWTDRQWRNPALEDYIIYELHTGTFSSSGNFHGIEEKVEYLKDLGITAIEIMPATQFPGERNWGYDGVFPFAVHNTYGGARGLQHLVNTCHKNNIAVILDVVYNHFGPEGNYLREVAPYFTNKYKTPWGDAINFDDAGCDGVRRFFIENALMWFRDFHIDALRLDAVHAIKDFSATHILKEIRTNVDLLIKQNWNMHYLIAEVDLNDTRYINPTEKEGYGMDAQWSDEFHHALRVTTGQQRIGYFSDFEGIRDLAKAYQDAYVYDGLYSPHRQKHFGTKTDRQEGHQFVVFSQNHDQVGNRMLGERTSKLVSFEMRKLLGGATLVSPFLPLLFMGEEYGETNPFLYFVSHSDHELIENVRNGRKAEFAAFHDEGEAPDPQSAETFNRSKLQWELLYTGSHKTILSFYKELISIRRKHPALRHLIRRQLAISCEEEKKTIQLYRWYQQHHVLCLMNFSESNQDVDVKTDRSWLKILDSADPQWEGPGATYGFMQGNTVVNLQPESIVIYTSQDV